MNPSKALLLFGIYSLHLLRCFATNTEDAFIVLPTVSEELTRTVVADPHRELQNSSSTAPTASPSFSNEYALPFQVVWNMAFSEETAVHEPTQEELTGLFYATLKWLLASAREYYADQSDTLILDRIDLTHYGATFNASEDYPSTVAMECACYFHANNHTDLPSVFEFLIAFSADFNRTIFLEDYLATADPETSMYHNVTELRYNIVPSDLGTSDSNMETVTINTEWKYKIGFGIPDREPTQEDYELLLSATNDWMVDLFLDAYPPNANGIPEFHMLETTIYDPIFNASQVPAHSMSLSTEVSFRVDSPPLTITQQDLMDILSNADLSELRDRYIHPASEPTLSLFFGVVTISFSPMEE